MLSAFTIDGSLVAHAPAFLESPYKPFLLFLPFLPWAWLVSSKLDKEAFGGEGLALAGEVGVEVKTVTDNDDDEEGQPAVIRGQRPSVAVGLVLGALHGLLPLPGAPPGGACFAPLPGNAEGCGRASAGPPYDVSGGERVARRREPAGGRAWRWR